MMELRLPPIRDLNLHDDVRQPAHPAPSQGPVVRDERLQKVGPLYHRPDHPTYFAQVLSHCQALCAFADHYATAPPPPQSPEVTQMVDRAVEVINILKEYKEAHCPPSAPPRPPKRPWEDPTDDIVTQRPAPSPPTDRVPSPITAPASPTNVVPPAQEAQMGVFDGQPERKSTVEDDAKAAAIRDMEDIRARRNQVQANASGKVKYKKRSRATPPGQCHSCEISDTPEWRRGPDGQRTLCNACGLHYAKLVRKRDRIISSLPAGGEAPPPIDIAFLRKSARMAAENSALARSSAGRRRTTEKDKAKTDSPAASSSKPPSTSTDEGRRTWERHEKESGPIKQYRHSTVTSPTFSAPPLSSPTRPLTLMPMTLPPPPQTRYPAPGQPPVTYGPSFQPYIQSGPASQPSYHMGPPGNSWSYDHGHPHYPPGSAQWGDRSMPPR
ncbi:zinc finger binding DNA consensus sequence [AT]GATA[AG] [Rhizoctonia solani]|uniref:Zinc finger binding DNA consensus sequence [AT]GATA[AG] n=1 Tax=Rhizoctonia solani TaxID=456999 RepID=A0A8H7LEP5_9AGAM|nr:zinc finger binding DNA consensus sequence [AT]GATA[AG] [Rhizoctonia solani]